VADVFHDPSVFVSSVEPSARAIRACAIRPAGPVGSTLPSSCAFVLTPAIAIVFAPAWS
jgi:hypothetical protein